MVDKSRYVVLDLETNGLKVKDDVLSISLYKPDDETCYDRYLPLECAKTLNPDAVRVNGITMEDLEGATPLTQQDVDELIERFELDRRIILTYSGFDERMLRHYFARKGLHGFDRFQFYDFKKDIISSKYSEGDGIRISKDNLCRLYGIENVRSVHSSMNDCILEWKLFERMDGKKLFVTDNKVFEMNHDYIIPVSYFSSHPNLTRFVPNFPEIGIETELVRRFELKGTGIERFPTTWNGIAIEQLLNQMLHVRRIDSRPFLLNNKSKLHYVGALPCEVTKIPVFCKEDGLLQAVHKEHEAAVAKVNRSTSHLKQQLEPLVSFLAEEIFRGEPIRSQELVIHKEDNVLALCDLSTDRAILEIKTNHAGDPFAYRNQLYYESNGRDCYLLLIDWSGMPEVFAIEIFSVRFSRAERKKTERKPRIDVEGARKKIENDRIELLHYAGQNEEVTLRCRTCGSEWQCTYRTAANRPKCPVCEPVWKRPKPSGKTDEERKKQRAEHYARKIMQASGWTIMVSDYTGAKENVTAKCNLCGNKRQIRADHLMSRPYCPRCKRRK